MAGKIDASGDTRKLPARREVLVGFAILQCFLGAGVVFGWTSILPMLEREGIYNELCSPGESFCNLQSIQLHFAFTIAASSSMCANLFLGLVFDRCGPRVGKILSSLFLIAGAILMGKAHKRQSSNGEADLFLPGMALLAFGGTGLQLCSIHLSNLFPEAKSLVTCLIVGALQLSFFIFGIFNFMYETLGVPQVMIFYGYAFVLAVSMVGSVFLSPSKPYQLEDLLVPPQEHHQLLSPIRLPSVFKKGESSLLLSTPQHAKNRTAKLPLVTNQGSLEDEIVTSTRDLKKRSFRTQVSSPQFILLSLLFSIGTLWCNYFLGSVMAQLRSKNLAPATVTSLMGAFGIILPGGVVFIPLVGYILEVYGYLKVTFACCVTSILFTLLFWSSTPWVIIFSFVIYTLYRTILFALVFAYIGHTFGFKNFGVLSGITFCIAAAVGLLQTPITQLGDFHAVGYLQLGSLLITLALPFYDLYIALRHHG